MVGAKREFEISYDPGILRRLSMALSIVLALLSSSLLAVLLFAKMRYFGYNPFVKFAVLVLLSVVSLHFFARAIQASRTLFSPFSLRLGKNGLLANTTDFVSMGWEEIAQIRRLDFTPSFEKGAFEALRYDLERMPLGPAVIVDAAPHGSLGVWHAILVQKAPVGKIALGRWFRPGFYYLRLEKSKSAAFESAISSFGGKQRLSSPVLSLKEFDLWAGEHF